MKNELKALKGRHAILAKQYSQSIIIVSGYDGSFIAGFGDGKEDSYSPGSGAEEALEFCKKYKILMTKKNTLVTSSIEQTLLVISSLNRDPK